MYAMEYTWMSEPTNVTSSTNVIDSGSTRMPRSTLNAPPGSQVPSSSSRTRSEDPSSATHIATATTSAATGVAVPSRWPHRSARRPVSSRTAAPASGSATSSHARPRAPSAGATADAGPAAVSTAGRPPSAVVITRSSALQQVDVVDRGRAAGAVDRHDDRQPDDHLGGRDDHDEERHHLAREVAVHPRERHERQVGRVEHELDAHEDDDRVAPDEHGQRADREQDRGEHEVVREVHRTCSSPVIARSGGVEPTASGPRWACTSPTERSWPRTRSTRGTECSSGRPPGPRAATSIALLRAYTPGAGSGVSVSPAATRASARSR